MPRCQSATSISDSISTNTNKRIKLWTFMIEMNEKFPEVPSLSYNYHAFDFDPNLLVLSSQRYSFLLCITNVFPHLYQLYLISNSFEPYILIDNFIVNFFAKRHSYKNRLSNVLCESVENRSYRIPTRNIKQKLCATEEAKHINFDCSVTETKF